MWTPRAAVDLVLPEWHPLARQAKDAASASVFALTVLALALWCAALVSGAHETRPDTVGFHGVYLKREFVSTAEGPVPWGTRYRLCCHGTS